MTPYYQDSLATIYCGDYREIVASLETVDLTLTDPPYGVPILHNNQMGPRGRGKIKVDGKNFPPVHGNDQPFNAADFMEIDRAVYHILWSANHYAHTLPGNGRWLIWDKRAKIIPPRTQADCELAWVSIYGAARVFYHYWDGMVKQSEHGETREHPTQKPVALMEWCLGFFPKVKTMRDPFMGSGTTLRAAKNMGLKCTGIEISEAYCEVAAKRLAQSFLPLEGATRPAPDQIQDTQTNLFGNN